MNCNCSNWEDDSPCPVHGERKLPRPEAAEHHCYVIRVYRRSSNLKWFYTVAKDALRIHTSPDFTSKPDLTNMFKE